MTHEWQPFVVENRPVAAGLLGAELVKAPAFCTPGPIRDARGPRRPGSARSSYSSPAG